MYSTIVFSLVPTVPEVNCRYKGFSLFAAERPEPSDRIKWPGTPLGQIKILQSVVEHYFEAGSREFRQ